MAKYQGSAFGTISGKALGVVAGTWKGQDYVRKYVVPANPRTQSQTETRTLFKDVAEFGKLFVNVWLNKMTAPKPKRASAFNEFVKRNMAAFKGTTFDEENVVFAEGSLPMPDTVTLTATVADGAKATFSTELRGDARDSDIAGLLIYDKTQKVVSAGFATRSAGTIEVTLPGIMVASDELILWFVIISDDYTASTDQKKQDVTLA